MATKQAATVETKQPAAQERARPLALVTGASAGLGREFALLLAERGHDLVVVARREERLVALKKEVAEKFGVRTKIVAEDLSHAAAPRRILDELRASKLEVDFLVNNAGYAINGGFAANEWSAHADFLQVMVTSWLHLAHGLVPAMVRKGRGRVLNVSSLASLCPEPPGSLYAPSKALMTTASRALRFELLGTGVHCTALCPGFTYTEFHDALGVRAEMDKMPKYMWQQARPVCLAGLEGVERNKAIVVPGAFNKTAAALCRVLPYSLTSKLIPKAVVER
jgi:short-subunit dehydrogenase